MKTFRRIFNKLSVKIISAIIVLSTLLTVMIGIFSYQVFTQTMLKEVTAYLKHISEFAVLEAQTWYFPSYLKLGAEGVERLQTMDLTEMEKIKDQEDVMTYKAYTETSKRLSFLCLTQDVREIDIIVPDKDDPGMYSIVFGMIAHPSLSIEFRTLGTKRRFSKKEEQEAARAIWAGEKKEEVLYDYEGREDDGAMVSLFKGLGSDDDLPEAVIILRRSMDDEVNTQSRFVIGITIMGAGMILIWTLLIGLYLRLRVVKPVDKITKEANRFAREVVKADQELAGDVGKITEIRVLAESIDKMEEDTMQNVEEITRMSRETERMDTELALASTLQKSVLPKGKEISGHKEFNVAAFMNPAREVGGDFYDFFMIDETHLVLMVADVSDKGMGAAFFMAVSKTLLKARAGMGGSAAEIVTYAEEKLSAENEENMFVTVWLGIVDIVTGEVNACNAGHNYPAILQKEKEDGYRIEKTEHGPPICFLPGMGHVEYNFRLCPGDRIFLYTDGVTEAKNTAGDRFENERLIEALNEDRDIGDESLIQRVKVAVDRFAGEEAQYDDMTMLSFTYFGR